MCFKEILFASSPSRFFIFKLPQYNLEILLKIVRYSCSYFVFFYTYILNIKYLNEYGHLHRYFHNAWFVEIKEDIHLSVLWSFNLFWHIWE